ncbi:MGMT family protein [Chryseobacterium salipaludis]|uniref:MGMT family protein n=1 Tax=Chryseobacterium TaxID=59732 RepID=UPI001FF6570B|nr:MULTISPECIES: MGMT family protein [Chryseobacterium]MCJ8497668.1 MGMT family protein [Chryseobacterium salipaludis]MCX3296077.1 MGMT family protein [Planobacterium sp. JC490]
MDPLFRKHIYEITRMIPRGKVTTYGAIATAVGYPHHARHVGQAMGHAPADVPVQRVIGAGGRIAVMPHAEILRSEGLEVENYRVRNFETVFWNPLEEIEDIP